MSGENEKLYKKLNTYKSEADFENIWSSIEQKREPKKRRFFVWLGGLLLLLMAFYVAQDFTKNESKEAYQNTSIENAVSQPQASNLQTVTSDNNQDELEEDKTAIQPIGKSKALSTIKKQDAGKSNENRTIVNIISHEDSNAPIQTSPGQASDSFNDASKTLSAIEQNDLPVINELGNLKEEQSKKIEVPYVVSKKERNVEAYNKLNTHLNLITYNRAAITPKLLLAATPINLSRNKKKWSLILTGGYGLHDKRLESTGSNDVWFQNRSTLEESMDVMNFGLLMEYALNTRFSIRSGLSYYRAYSRSNQVINTQESVLMEDQIIKVIVGFDGTETVERGDVLATKTEQTTYTRYTTLSDFELPVLLNFKAIKASSFDLSLLMGPSFTVHSSAKGEIVNQTLTAYEKVEDLDIHTSRKVSFQTGIEIQTSISKTVGLGFGLFSRVALGSVYSDPFTAKPLDLSGNASVIKRF